MILFILFYDDDVDAGRRLLAYESIGVYVALSRMPTAIHTYPVCRSG